MPEEDDVNEEVENEEAMPNNNFCFTNDDFMEYCTELNNAIRHQGKYREASNTVKVLEGHEEKIPSTTDGKVVWKVVEKATDDDFKEIRQFEDKKLKDTKYSPIKDPVILEDLNYVDDYWYLWPTNVDEDVAKINIAIAKENHSKT